MRSIKVSVRGTSPIEACLLVNFSGALMHRLRTCIILGPREEVEIVSPVSAMGNL